MAQIRPGQLQENVLYNISSSYAITASYAENAGGGSGFPFTGSALITGSLGITGSLSVSSSTITGINLQAGRSLIQTSPYGVDGEIFLDTNYGGYDSSLLYLYSGSNGDDYVELSALGNRGFIGFYLDNYDLAFEINANDYQYIFYTQPSKPGTVQLNYANLGLGENKFYSTSSFAIGQGNTLTGSYVATIGNSNTINGQNSLTIGSFNTINGQNSLTIGTFNTTLGNNHLIVGQSNSTLSTINTCLIVGNSNQTLGKWEIGAAFGSDHTLNAENSFAQGNNNTINGTGGHAEGRNNALLGIYSHVEGFNNSATGSYSHAEGNSTIAIGDASHAEGSDTTASGSYSHAEGEQTVARGRGSHAEGYNTTASGNNSHAEGSESVASGGNSHAEGTKGSTASGNGSHAEGVSTRATATGAHSEGDNTTASGEASHAEGNSTVALGLNSHAEGQGTIASGSYQHAQGTYNTQNNISSLMIIGNGKDEFSRSDLALFNTDGIVFNQPLTGSIISGSFVGDGSGLSGVGSFPFSGSAVITGSLTVSQSVVDFTSASAVLLNIDDIPLVNPIVEYVDTAAVTASGTTITLPNALSYVSSSTYEYLEVFINGLRLRYNRDFVPISDTSIRFDIAIPSGSEVTYKSLKRP